MTSRDGAEAAWVSTPTAPTTSEPANDAAVTPAPVVTLPVDLPTMLKEIENAYINAALAQTRSNKKEAAKLLGMGRTTLVEKLRRRSIAASRSEAGP
jgi:sigma-54 dependent transcriptional regulator, flagellar regulatory protein